MSINFTDPNFRATDLRDLDTKITALYALVTALPGIADVPESRDRDTLERELDPDAQESPVSPEVARAMFFIQTAIKKARQGLGYA